MKLRWGRGETLEHDGEIFLGKLPFFIYRARETQSSNLRHCQNHELQGTTNDKSCVQPQGNYQFSEGCGNPYCLLNYPFSGFSMASSHALNSPTVLPKAVRALKGLKCATSRVRKLRSAGTGQTAGSYPQSVLGSNSEDIVNYTSHALIYRSCKLMTASAITDVRFTFSHFLKTTSTWEAKQGIPSSWNSHPTFRLQNSESTRHLHNYPQVL